MENLNLRNLYYEAKPLVLAAAGLYTLSLHSLGPIGKMAGFILLSCGIAIIYMRACHRGLIR